MFLCSSSYDFSDALHMQSIMHSFGVCAAASTMLVVAIAKFRSYFMIKIGITSSMRDSSYYLFLVVLARKVSILGLSTEWDDRLFQSIIVRGRNENL